MGLHNPLTGVTPAQYTFHDSHRKRMEKINRAAVKPIVVAEIIEIEPPVSKPERDAMADWVERQKKIPMPYKPWFCIVGEYDAPPEPVKQSAVIDIQRVVAESYGITRSDLISPRRTPELAKARHVAVYLTKKLTIRSLPEVGRHFGGRDHTTILHSVNRVKQMLATDEAFAKHVDSLERQIEAINA